MKGFTSFLGIFLLFMLVGGIILIYQEEIRKAEFFGRLQTTPTAKVNVPEIPDPPLIQGPVPNVQRIKTGATKVSTTNAFRKNRSVQFGNGRIVDTNVRDVETTDTGITLHTIVSGVTNYYARGFLEESSRLYDPSPHAGSIIFLDRTSGVKESDPDREYFVLLAANTIQTPINITNWKIFDRKGKTSYKLPKGIKILGTTGGLQQHTPIRVEPGETIIVSSGRSPVGNSFKINKCSGYRSQFKKFTPTVKTNCPDPMEEFIEDSSVPYTDNKCYEIINRLPKCRAITDIPTGVTKQCRDFIQNTLTEKGCITHHRNDPDFFTSEWRLFLESEKELWKNRDNVLYLLDENNLLVATLVYR